MSRDPRDWQADMDMCDQATTGPWKVYQVGKETLIGTEYDHPQLHAPDSIVGHAYSVDGEMVYIRDKDAQLLAHSREALPYWLQQAAELASELAYAKGQAIEWNNKAVAEKERADRVTEERARFNQVYEMLLKKFKTAEERERKLKEAIEERLPGMQPVSRELMKRTLATLYPLERGDANDNSQ